MPAAWKGCSATSRPPGRNGPGVRVERISELQEHHDVARFAWRATLPDGTVLPDSLDVVTFDGDGKLLRIIGFFGPLAVGG